ncbi:MAG: ABC transporter permease, partial [Clostridiales bacterium]|jgi:cell division transport system permease protein|nr:ABC transporter permease [Clostridiales bacterium]
MKFSAIKYYISSSLESIYKNRLMSIASILTVASCIAIFIFSFCLAINLDSVLENLERSIAFNIYIDDKISDDDFNSFYDGLTKVEYVDRVDVVSKEDALLKMQEKIPSYMLQGLEDDNPLPRTFEVYLNNTKNQAYVLSEVKLLKAGLEQKYQGEGPEESVNENIVDPSIPQVEEDTTADEYLDRMLDPEELIRISYTETDKLVVANNFIRIASIVVVAVMTFLSIVIIMNTIKLAVNIRKREINIMKYVGATDSFIRWPFIIEGVIIGSVGAIIPTVIGWLTYSETMHLINGMVPMLGNLYPSGLLKMPEEIFYYLAPVSVIFGILIGTLGSVSSIRKHLEV